MITVELVLSVGTLSCGRYDVYHSYDMEIQSYDDDVDCDNINNLLIQQDEHINYAELRLRVSGIPHDGFLIGTFKKIKLKNKGSRWALSD